LKGKKAVSGIGRGIRGELDGKREMVAAGGS